MPNQKNQINNSATRGKGFTLLELIIYLGIISLILLIISTFLVTFLKFRVKNQAIAEVEQQGSQVMRLITQTIRNAENINSPTQGGSASSLSIDAVEITNDPTIFDLAGGTIRITQGVKSPVSLTNSRVIAAGLNFQNLSRNNAPPTIRIQFTLSHLNPQDRNEYRYTKIFYGSASLRK